MTSEIGSFDCCAVVGDLCRPGNLTRARGIAAALALLLAGATASSQTVTTSNPPPVAVSAKPPPGAVREKTVTDRLWSVEFGVGVISDNTPADYLEGDFERLDGPGGGVTYNITFSRQWTEFDWNLWGMNLNPQLERVAMLTLVDENSGRVIPDLNVGLVFRWQDFPWNRFVRTTLAVGAGFSYSFEIWTADKLRHPGEDRSRIKFWMPVELTVALPRFPRHQVVAFLDHQSGGQVFDNSGVDVWGLGYRFEF
jgi:hypothetical protein